MSERVLIFILIPILAISGIYAVNSSFEDAGVDGEITGERFDGPAGGGLVSLEQSNRQNVFYRGTVTVYNENGNLTVEGTDYIWHQDNGTLEVLAGGELDGVNNAEIDYGYDVPTVERREAAETWGKTQDAVVKPLLIIVPMAILFLAFGRLVG